MSFIDGTELFKSLVRSMDLDWIWYILHFCTFSFYGGIIDTIKNSIKKKKENKMMAKDQN